MLNKKLNIENNLKRGIAGLLSLSLAFGVFTFPNVSEASAVKTKTVTFSEELDGNNRSQTINIPDVSQIVGTRIVGGSTNGSSSATITGKDTVKVNVSGGSPSRTATNPQKYSQYVTDFSTSSTDNFSLIKAYNNGGYIGNLPKNGSSWVTSGSYTSGDSKYVTNQTSSWYNSGGYSGSLSSYVYSGSITPGYTEALEERLPLSETRWDTLSYMYKGQRVTLYFSGTYREGGTRGTNYHLYLGTYESPPIDTRVYRYQGTVTKPSVDTRQWRQDYAGTVYKSGTDNFYSYTVEVDYIDDVTAPTITHALSPSNWTKEDVAINITATDSQSGVKNITLPDGTVVNGDSASYSVSSNGTYTFYATDNANNKTNAYNVTVSNIDKTNPIATHTLTPTTWTKDNVILSISASDSLSGLKHIELPNGSKVTTSTASQSIPTNGTYSYKVVDNVGNETVQSFTITNIDKTAPTNGDLNFKPSKNGEMTYSITNSVETGSGLKAKPLTATISSETKEEEVINSALNNTVKGFSGNEKVNIKYTLTDNVENTSISSDLVSKYSFAIQPTLGEVRGYTGDNITFKYEHPVQHNDAKYKFKAVSSTGEEVFSSIYDYDSLVTISGLRKNIEYTLYATAINNDNVENEYVKLKSISEDGSEVDLVVTTKNKTQITTSKSEGFNKHTFIANVKDIDLDQMKAELIVGDKVILLDNTLYKTNVSESRTLNITLDKAKTGVTRSIEGAKDIFTVGINLPNAKYPVTLRTTKDGDIQNLDLGVFGIDTVGPTIEKPSITYLAGGRGILSINSSSIKDLSSQLSQIQMDYGNGYQDIRAQIMTNKETKILKLKDRLGNVSEVDVTQLNSYEDSLKDNDNNNDDNNSGDDINKIPDNIKDNVVTVDVPKGGTHMQTSLDGVTWSNWETRKDKTTVTLSTGDGLKSVYVRTGIQKFKETPVFNSETGRIEFVSQEGGEVEPLNNTKVSKFVIDLSAPSLKIRTMDNSLIAINGNITVLMDITDSLDKSPGFKVELLERDANGILEKEPKAKNVWTGTTNGSSTGSISFSNLKELRTNKNKLQPYTLKVTAFDKYGNKTVEHLNFYSKTKS